MQRKNEAVTQETPPNTQPKVDTDSEPMKAADACFSSLNSQISDDVNSTQSAAEIDQKSSMVVQRLREFASLCDQSTAEQLLNDFNTLPQPDMNACRACLEPQNIKKNRYSNIPCLDTSRVLLTFRRPEVGYGYIHANRIEYPTLRSKYIITQGPLPNTVNAFWQMIWQENVYSIVMLCQPIEQGKRKSAEYFSPSSRTNRLRLQYYNMIHCDDNKFTYISLAQDIYRRSHLHKSEMTQWTLQICDTPISYDQLNVVLKERKWEDSLIISTLEVEYLQESRQITHYHWRDWKDWTAPTEPTLLNLLKRVRGRSAVVVHCSAGVGRSGTFMALEMCLQDLANGLPINVNQVIVCLRRCRALAVQTFEQYLAIHRAILSVGEKHGVIMKADVAHFYRLCEQQKMSG